LEIREFSPNIARRATVEMISFLARTASVYIDKFPISQLPANHAESN